MLPVQIHSHIIMSFEQIRQMMCGCANGGMLAAGWQMYNADASAMASIVGKCDTQTARFQCALQSSSPLEQEGDFKQFSEACSLVSIWPCTCFAFKIPILCNPQPRFHS